MKNEITILTYEHIHGMKIDREKIIKLITELDYKSILHIGALIVNREKDMALFESCYEMYILKSSGKKIEDINKFIRKKHIIRSQNNTLISLQSLLLLLKYSYVYSDVVETDDYVSDSYDNEEFGRLINIQLMLADYMQEEIEDKELLRYNMMKFNQSVNLKNLFARTWHMYTVLAKQTTILGGDLNKYLPINEEWEKKYGFTISEMLSVLFYMNVVYFDKKMISPLIEINSFFDKASDSVKCNLITKYLSLDYDNFVSFCKNTLDNSWDFELLSRYPLIEVDSPKYLLTSNIHLQAYIYHRLRDKIQELFGEGGNEVATFIGYPFESYVQEMLISSIYISEFGYKYKNEFNIKKGVKSSEFYISFGNKMIIFEAKGKDIKRDKLFGKLDKDIMRGILNLQFRDPIMQIDDRYSDILESQYSELLDGIEDVIAISITQENNHLSVENYHSYVVNQIENGYEIPKKDKTVVKKKKNKVIDKYFNFSIEEVECLCWLIENNVDIFDVLTKYYTCSSNTQFYEFLTNEDISFQVNPKKLDEIWNSFRNEMNRFFLETK